MGHITMEKILFYDTTLRDGMQAEGISFSLEDKLAIAKCLDNLAIDYIEGGYAASGLEDGVNAVLDVIAGEDSPKLPKSAPVSTGSVLDSVVEQVSRAHHR